MRRNTSTLLTLLICFDSIVFHSLINNGSLTPAHGQALIDAADAIATSAGC